MKWRNKWRIFGGGFDRRRSVSATSATKVAVKVAENHPFPKPPVKTEVAETGGTGGIVIAAICLLFAILFTAPTLAAPPPPGSEDDRLMAEFRIWVESQYNSKHQYCCNISDGRPLFPEEIRYQSGHYQILYTHRHWDDGTEEWLDVPADAIIRTPNPIGMPVAWIMHGHVFCLSLSGAV